MFSEVLSGQIQGKLVVGDCLEVMPLIPDKSIDMILCDLPYGTTACKWDTIIPFEPLWEQYKRIIKDHGAIVLTASQPFTSFLITSNIKWFKYCWVWDKVIGTGFQTAKYQPMKAHEDVVVFGKGTVNYYPIKTKRDKPIKGYATASDHCPGAEYDIEMRTYTDKYPISILTFQKVKKTIHPTQKPVSLFEYLIKTYTKENEIVLDNCIGSGTTAIAAQNLNRRWIGIELDKEYFNLANERIERNREEIARRLF